LPRFAVDSQTRCDRKQVLRDSFTLIGANASAGPVDELQIVGKAHGITLCSSEHANDFNGMHVHALLGGSCLNLGFDQKRM
jgi:hypothetical protein